MARSRKDGRRGGGHCNFNNGMRLKAFAMENGKPGGWDEGWSPEHRRHVKKVVTRQRRRISKNIAREEMEKHLNDE